MSQFIGFKRAIQSMAMKNGGFISRQRANLLITKFEMRNQKNSHYPHIKKRDLARELRARVETPSLIDQGDASLCGPAAFLYILVKSRPVMFVQYVIDLYEKGEARLGMIHVKPSRKCKKFNINININAKNSNKPGQQCIAGCDWIALASLRDSENKVLKYDTVKDQVSGITLPCRLKKWFKSTGFNAIEKDTKIVFDENHKNLLRMAALQKQGYEVIVFINSNLLSRSAKNSIFPNHWIVLNDSVCFDGQSAPVLNSRQKLKRSDILQKKISFKLFTWGKTYNFEGFQTNKTVKEFLKHYFGFIAVK